MFNIHTQVLTSCSGQNTDEYWVSFFYQLESNLILKTEVTQDTPNKAYYLAVLCLFCFFFVSLLKSFFL